MLQASAWYGPHHVGGTEVYVESLVEALALIGIGGTVLTPRVPDGPDRYRHGGHDVETYPVTSARPGEMRTGARHGGFETFQRLLAAHPGAIYHQHSWTRGCGLAHLQAARALGLRTVLTIHVPAVTCLRGAMLRFGTEPCSGEVMAGVCGACWAHGKGLPRKIAAPVANLPLAVARGARRLPSQLATALAARAIAAERAEQLRAMIAAADRIVAVCRWLADALLLNGVPADRLIINRQGLRHDFAIATAAPTTRTARPLALLYLGRLDPIKGIDVLVRAIRAARCDLRLTVRGVAQTDADRAYAARLRALAADDPRILFAAALPRSEILPELERHDVLAVPSRIMETGPLVVLEARAAGLFVLGSRLGGIAELVQEDGDGQLVDVDDVAAWTRAIEDLAARGLRRGSPTTVRSMSDVAAEMAELYDAL